MSQILRKPWVQRTVGSLLAGYIRLVRYTNRISCDPLDLRPLMEAQMPVIATFWHGQHALMPLLKTRTNRVRVLISRHRDGEINAVAAESFGIETIRGSGDHGGEFRRKGGVTAFMEMARGIEDGYNMALTADVPKVSRVAGLGVIMLARASGRPIWPVAIASTRFKRLNNWDRSVIPLPFGRIVIASGTPVMVPPDADEATMERLRREVEDNLNETTRRAYARVGRSDAVGRVPADRGKVGQSEVKLG